MAISNAGARSQMAGRVISAIAARDPAQARQWLEASDMPAHRKEEMREFIDSGGKPPAGSGSEYLRPPGATFRPR